MKKIISFAMNISALSRTTDFVGYRDMDSYTEEGGFFGLLGECLAEAGCEVAATGLSAVDIVNLAQGIAIDMMNGEPPCETQLCESVGGTRAAYAAVAVAWLILMALPRCEALPRNDTDTLKGMARQSDLFSYMKRMLDFCNDYGLVSHLLKPRTGSQFNRQIAVRREVPKPEPDEVRPAATVINVMPGATVNISEYHHNNTINTTNP